MSKFKVGDEVEIVESNCTEGWFDLTVQRIFGVIEKVNEDEDWDRYYVSINGYEGIYENDWFAFNDEHLKLVSENDKAVSNQDDILKRTLMNSGDGGVVKCEVVDNVNSPNHYSSQTIECIVAMEAMLSPEEFIGYLRGNIFKYQWRYKQKNGLEDLKKAQWYQNKLIEKEESK